MHTILSAFDNLDAAERAVDLLASEGFPRENMHVETSEAIDHFFDRLLGHKHQSHARTYSEAVRRGGAVVVVDTSSEVSAERAVTVMQENGAYEIAERAEQWRQDGWSAVASGEQHEDGGVVRWRTAHVIHRDSGRPLSDILEESNFHSQRRVS